MYLKKSSTGRHRKPLSPSTVARNRSILPEISLAKVNSSSPSVSINHLSNARSIWHSKPHHQNRSSRIILPSIPNTCGTETPIIANLHQTMKRRARQNRWQNQPSLCHNSAFVGGISQRKNCPSSHDLDRFRFEPSRIVCLHSETNRYMNEFDNMIVPLKEGIDAIVIFIDSDELINFLKKIPNEKIFFFITSDLAPSILHRIRSILQLYAIFLIDGKLVENEPWIQQWTQIKDPSVINDLAAEEVMRKNDFSCANSRVHSASSTQLNLLPRSFMLTQLLKEIFVQMKDDDEQAKKDLIGHCRQHYANNLFRIKVLKQFERDYRPKRAIYWYSRDCFFHQVVNGALRSEKITDIFMMRLLIRDIHRQIEQLHPPLTETQIFYRGQCLPCTEFEQLRLKAGGLYSFNSFLSTSKNYDVAYSYAEGGRCTDSPVQVGVLFRIHIDSNACEYVAFTSVSDVSCYEDLEEEVLFTTHTIFRIGPIRQLGNQLWQVDLFSTSRHDKQLQLLNSSIRDATEGSTEWDRLGKFLLNLGFFDMVKEVLDLLMAKSKKGSSHYYHLMGLKKLDGGHHRKALSFFQRALQTYTIDSSTCHLHLVHIHFDTGSVYQDLGDYSEALKSFRLAMDLQKQSLPINHSALLSIYMKIARIYTITECHVEALRMHEKVLTVRENFVPTNELELADVYRNIAKSYYHLKNYSESLSALRKVACLRQSCIRRDDPKSTAFACIVELLEEKTREPEKNLENNRKRLACEEKLRRLRTDEPSNHRDPAIQYDLMGQIYLKMKDYSRALDCYCSMLHLLQRSGYEQQTDVASTLDKIGEIHERLENREQACLLYGEAILIEQKLCQPNLGRLQLYRRHLRRAQKIPDFFDDEFYGCGF